MSFHFFNITLTRDKFITLILALIIIFFLLNELVKLLQKSIKSRKTSDLVTRLLFIAFMGIACFFLLKYTFGWR